MPNCSVCFCDEVDTGLNCKAEGGAEDDGTGHFVCHECLGAYVCARAGRLDECGRMPCALGASCSRGYLAAHLAHHVSAQALAVLEGASEQAQQALLASERERAELAVLPPRERRLREARWYIAERILTLACPRCGQAFAEALDGARGYNGCCALTCARADCGCAFCAYCIADCGANAHEHVRGCVHGSGLYADRDGFERAQRARRKRMLRAYLASHFGGDEYSRVTFVGQMAPLLLRHGIELQPHIGMPDADAEASATKAERSWSVDTGCGLVWSTEICTIAALGGRLGMLQWARARGCPWGALTCSRAALNGHLDVLQWARANGCAWDETTCASAAYGGKLVVLQWARANGCAWDASTCASAAAGGHLPVLQWARANGCAWDEVTCAGVAFGGHLSVLRWARANGCPWDELTCSEAARGGHLAVLQCARAHGCPWDELTCILAADAGHEPVLRWARANGCPRGSARS